MRTTLLAITAATGILAAAANAAILNNLDTVAWRIQPGAAGTNVANGTSGGGGTADVNRGLAFNPVTRNVLVAGGSATAPNVYVYRGTDGAFVSQLSTTGITGGARLLTQIAVADDGAIYGTNLTTTLGTNALKVYKWDNEADTTPSVVYQTTTIFPAPAFSASTGTARVGDSFNVRGSGAGTRIVFGEGTASPPAGQTLLAGQTNRFAVLSPTDAAANAFDAVAFQVAANGDFRQGLTFGEDGSIYAKEVGDAALQRITYDLATGTATLANSFTANILSSIGPLAYSDVLKQLAAVNVVVSGTASSHATRLYSTGGDPATLAFLDSEAFSALAGVTPAANANGSGAADFGIIDGVTYLFALGTNNGVVAYVPEPVSLTALAGMILFSSRRRR